MSALLLALETLLAPFAALGVLLSFALSRRRGRLAGFSGELPERLGSLSAAGRAALAGRRVWWIHAASAGEVGGLAPVLETLAARPGAPAFLLTTTTVAGREAARRLPVVAWAQLAPLDAWPCVSRFLDAAAPERLVLAETELWPSTLLLAARRGLRPALVNARMTPRSFGRYRLIAPFLAPALRALSAVGAQSAEDAARFEALGLPSGRARVTGNAKYDRGDVPAAAEAVDARLRALGWDGAPLFVAGSTHPVEEEAVVAAFRAVSADVPGLRLVLAPRHVERAAEALATLTAAGLKTARWSAPAEDAPGARALLVDGMGVLPAFFARARAAFVGGTLVPVGGHNLLEPALAGVPVLFGPNTGHIALPARLLSESGGAFRVAGAAELRGRLEAWAADAEAARAAGAKARAAAESLRGAAARAADLLEAHEA
jgi:3-deoxy-D-manno-octulosonic-acid transferase